MEVVHSKTGKEKKKWKYILVKPGKEKKKWK